MFKTILKIDVLIVVIWWRQHTWFPSLRSNRVIAAVVFWITVVTTRALWTAIVHIIIFCNVIITVSLREFFTFLIVYSLKIS